MFAKKYLEIIGLFTFAFLTTSCSMMPKKEVKVKITSNPSAEVILGYGNHDLGKSIGKTPFDIDFSEIAKGDFIYLKFKNSKYEDYQLVVPSDWKSGTINVKLKEKDELLPVGLEDKLEEKLKLKMSEMSISQIFSVLEFQKQLQQGAFSKAASEIVNLKRLQTPNAVIALLEGNLSFMKGKKSEALNFYKRSYELYPQNYELKSVIDELKK